MDAAPAGTGAPWLTDAVQAFRSMAFFDWLT
jgi:hypothetical protein